MYTLHIVWQNLLDLSQEPASQKWNRLTGKTRTLSLPATLPAHHNIMVQHLHNRSYCIQPVHLMLHSAATNESDAKNSLHLNQDRGLGRLWPQIWSRWFFSGSQKHLNACSRTTSTARSGDGILRFLERTHSSAECLQTLSQNKTETTWKTLFRVGHLSKRPSTLLWERKPSSYFGHKGPEWPNIVTSGPHSGSFLNSGYAIIGPFQKPQSTWRPDDPTPKMSTVKLWVWRVEGN